MPFLLKLGLAILVLWGSIVAVFALMQGALLFPRAMVGPAPSLPATSRSLQIERPDGVILHGVLIPGNDPERPALLGFGGNAWNAAAMALFLHDIMPDHSVVAFHFRGYAPSTGRPSASALLTDAEVIHDHLISENLGMPIAVGFSIGSGVAAHLAAQRPIRGAVLVTPFDSLGAVARQSLPWAPVRWLFRHEMDALGALSRSEVPVALILADQDEVIPPVRAEALVSGLQDYGREAVFLRRLATGHNAIYGHPEFAPALTDAISALTGQ